MVCRVPSPVKCVNIRQRFEPQESLLMSYRRNARLIAATFLAATRLLAVDTETDERGRPVASRQVIIQLNSTPVATLLQQIGQLADADEVRTLNSRINLVLLHSRSGNVTALTNILKKLPYVSLVEPDFILKSTT